MLPDPGANLDLRAADLADALLARARALYVSGYTLLREPTRAAAAAMIARARAAGVPVAVDPASAAPLAADPGALAAAAPFDLLLPNADEAAVLGDARLAREVVVTHGADGARWSDGERTRSIAAVAAAARDTTGAGDAFAAGFLSAWPGPVEEALRRGAALAAEAVAGAGARPR
jgi:sugar/nucleoside kinase (ribokinase family)